MGVKKSKSKKSAKSKISATQIAKGLIRGNKENRGTKRSSRMTPERLSKKILVEKLKKRLFRIKYGGGK